ncbi:uncharacterized protein [Branchiostoma lanceolatum]|uniref:uncharacterized protein n=1 Tax=Branchiostoma lanceolatum TaxID=7740 RepID=UPI0034520977
MGKGDRCAVFGCNNDRRYPEKLLIKDHVTTIKWHYCPPKSRRIWTKLLNREGFEVTSNTRICSNHFVLGGPHGQHPHPCLYMRGPDTSTHSLEIQEIISGAEPTSTTTTRGGQVKRAKHETRASKVAKISSDHCYDTPSVAASEEMPLDSPPSPCRSSSFSCQDLKEEHGYAFMSESEVCTCVKCEVCKRKWRDLEHDRDSLREERDRLKEEMEKRNSEVQTGKDTVNHIYDIENLKHSDKLIHLHTGLASYALFIWIFSLIKPKLPYMQYFKSSQSQSTKSYQVRRTNKPGPKRLLSYQNELLVTLMKIKLNLSEQFLAHLFSCGISLISQVLSTWLPLLSLELRCLIHWPTRNELKLYMPSCFAKYRNMSAIIDCTEVPLQRPSLAKANSQIYSKYKGRATAKILVACTPSGTISFVSSVAGGNMSDKEMVKRSGILDKFAPGDTILADRGFNIQELLLDKPVRLEIPPFLKKKKQFSESENKTTKQVANARIHVERVIGRMKDFNIMKAELPLDMADLFDHIVIIVASLVNLQPPIIPL